MNKPFPRGAAAPLLVLSAFALLAPSMAAAQQSSGYVLEEVIVTATRREQNLQDVGVTVTALDQEMLERAGVNDISRLELVTPGLSYGFIGSDAKVALRGANSNNTFADNSSIAGFFVDGVYRPRASQQTQAFFDVDRVEVLKGPQGTLYGRNTFAGAINLYTNRPDFDGRSVGVRAGFERFGRVHTEGFINAPVNDEFALRAAFNTRDSNGYIDNNGPAEDLGQEESRNFRISGLWQPTDEFEALLRVQSLSEEGITAGIFAAEGICQPVNASGVTDAFGPGSNCDNPYPESAGDSNFDDEWEVNTDVSDTRDNEEISITLDLSWDVTDVLNLRSITSYTDFDSEFDTDGDRSPQPGYIFFWDEEVESITQELQAIFTTDTFTVTSGLYFSEDEIEFGFSQYRQDPPFTTAGFSDFADYQEIDNTTIGVYAQVDYSILDNLRLIAGIRYSEEDKDTDSFSGSSTDEAGDPLPGVTPLGLTGRARDIYRYTLIPENSANQEFDDTTYRLGVEWDVSDAVMLYANYSTGFLSGGVNADGSAFQQQESDAYEAGMKSRWLDNTLQANVAVYYNEYTDLTTQELVDLGGGVFQTRTVNGGEIETYGLEADLTWLPTEELILTAGLSIMDNEFQEFGVLNPFVEANGEVLDPNFLSLEGDTPPWAPDLTLSLSIGYDYDMGNLGRLTPFLQFYYSDSYNTDDVVTYPQQEQDSYTKTDFRLIWTTNEQDLIIEAFVENIEDEEVLARTNVGGFDLVQTSYLYPRNYGVRISYFL